MLMDGGTMNEIGGKIRSYRKYLGMTQQDLADAAGISVMSVRRYESGDRYPNKDTVKKIAAVLKVPPKAIVGDAVSDGDARATVNEFRELMLNAIHLAPLNKDAQEEYLTRLDKGTSLFSGASSADEIGTNTIFALMKEGLLLVWAGMSHKDKLLFLMDLLNDNGKDMALEKMEELASDPHLVRDSDSMMLSNLIFRRPKPPANP
ncbi:transcriptional repressor DicA [Anaerotruncus sp. 2789STDY5834896]|uniref:Transcriptional repressor DicA n=1 Tax=uncultured Anaerotruncus sp. TaxID=905011 RepID=A0A1C6JI37_9FIRM|nr:transcriptional repressor DicA [uncultured Anaerotruncus sp.]